jgi:hypothetical protein
MRCRHKSNTKSHIFEHRLDWELKLDGKILFIEKIYKFITKIIWKRYLLDLEMEAPGTFSILHEFHYKQKGFS